jgi:hypothetical protein
MAQEDLRGLDDPAGVHEMKLEDLHKVTLQGDGVGAALWMQCSCGWHGPKHATVGVVLDTTLNSDKLMHLIGQIQVEDPRNRTAPREAFNS